MVLCYGSLKKADKVDILIVYHYNEYVGMVLYLSNCVLFAIF